MIIYPMTTMTIINGILNMEDNIPPTNPAIKIPIKFPIKKVYHV